MVFVEGSAAGDRTQHNPDGAGPGWFSSEFTLHGVRRRKPGLNSVRLGDSIDIEIGVDVDRGAPLCVSISHLVSYEHMGAVHISCVPPCSCAPKTVVALEPASHVSVLHSAHVAVRSPQSTCWLRLTNVQPAPPVAAHDFHIAGIQTFLPNDGLGRCGLSPSPALGLGLVDDLWATAKEWRQVVYHLPN